MTNWQMTNSPESSVIASRSHSGFREKWELELNVRSCTLSLVCNMGLGGGNSGLPYKMSQRATEDSWPLSHPFLLLGTVRSSWDKATSLELSHGSVLG